MYGPECTYDVLVNTSLANVVHENDNFCVMIATELKCRPKGHDILGCRFQNSKIRRPDERDSSRCTNAKDFIPAKYKFVDQSPFEIRFNPRGIENLVVHRTISRWQLDMIKVIVSQLNIGFVVEERRDRFTIMENSTVGHCEVDVKITHDVLGYEEEEQEEDDDSTETEDFRIEFMSPDDREVQPSVGRFHIEKTREPKRCPRRTIYFFGDNKDYSRGDGQVYMDMVCFFTARQLQSDKLFVRQ